MVCRFSGPFSVIMQILGGKKYNIRHVSLILAWMINDQPNEVQDGINYPLSNFNGCTVEIWEWTNNFIPHFYGCNYLSMLGLELNHVSKRGLRSVANIICLINYARDIIVLYFWAYNIISYGWMYPTCRHTARLRPYPSGAVMAVPVPDK